MRLFRRQIDKVRRIQLKYTNIYMYMNYFCYILIYILCIIVIRVVLLKHLLNSCLLFFVCVLHLYVIFVYVCLIKTNEKIQSGKVIYVYLVLDDIGQFHEKKINTKVNY